MTTFPAFLAAVYFLPSSLFFSLTPIFPLSFNFNLPTGPVYSRANGPELWVMLLEKAFAKLAGCYDMLRGGLAYEALMDLTGCPTSSYSIEDTPPNELWELLEREDKNDNIMSASVTGVGFYGTEDDVTLIV